MKKFLILAVAVAVLSACATYNAPVPTPAATRTVGRFYRQPYATLSVKNSRTESIDIVSFGKSFAKAVVTVAPGGDSSVVITTDDLVPGSGNVIALGMHTQTTNLYFSADPIQINSGDTLRCELTPDIANSGCLIKPAINTPQARNKIYRFKRFAK